MDTVIGPRILLSVLTANREAHFRRRRLSKTRSRAGGTIRQNADICWRYTLIPPK